MFNYLLVSFLLFLFLMAFSWARKGKVTGLAVIACLFLAAIWPLGLVGLTAVGYVWFEKKYL